MKRVFAVDNIENAVLATQSNAQALGYHDKIKSVMLDIVENYGEHEEQVKNQEVQVKYKKGIKAVSYTHLTQPTN